jgi:FlaA1/EpsC-like NDP-sugar epimerase
MSTIPTPTSSTPGTPRQQTLRLAVPPTPRADRPVLIGDSRSVSDLDAQIRATPGLALAIGIIADLDPAALTSELDRLKPDCALLCHDPVERDRYAPARRILRERQIPIVSISPLRSLIPAATEQAPRPSPPRMYVAPGSAWSAARIDLAALLDRAPLPLDTESVASLVKGKRVLITGAGGSIGSELARIVASFDPGCVVLMERAENALFEIDRQLGARFRTVQRRAVLHDVVDPERTLQHLVDLRPDIIFHAAAHKHVPLMEDHPAHAVTNNFFGTRSIADAALAIGAERFVLISSDKAVNPTSVMGATKRLAEIYVQELHRQAHASVSGSARTEFSMVRFGNVLGSSCSVVPIWSAQLVDGGPLTVTDPRMTRYFMTINEAAGLVIRAAAIDDPSPMAPVYVLDMGEPVRILDLARRFLEAHGYTPRLIDRDGRAVSDPSIPTALSEPGPAGLQHVDILMTGIRPGEKLHEELAYSRENLRPTGCPGIQAWAAMPGDVSLPSLVSDLGRARQSGDASVVLSMIRRHVPEMNRT